MGVAPSFDEWSGRVVIDCKTEPGGAGSQRASRGGVELIALTACGLLTRRAPGNRPLRQPFLRLYASRQNCRSTKRALFIRCNRSRNRRDSTLIEGTQLVAICHRIGWSVEESCAASLPQDTRELRRPPPIKAPCRRSHQVHKLQERSKDIVARLRVGREDRVLRMPEITEINPRLRSKDLDRLHCSCRVGYLFCGLLAEVTVYGKDQTYARQSGRPTSPARSETA